MQSSTDQLSLEGGSLKQCCINNCSHDGGCFKHGSIGHIPQMNVALYRVFLVTVPQKEVEID